MPQLYPLPSLAFKLNWELGLKIRNKDRQQGGRTALTMDERSKEPYFRSGSNPYSRSEVKHIYGPNYPPFHTAAMPTTKRHRCAIYVKSKRA